MRSRFWLLVAAGFVAAVLLFLTAHDLRRMWGNFRRSWTSTMVSWEGVSPGSAGFDRERIAALRDTLASRNTWSFLVARGGRIVLEWYAMDASAGERHYTASLAKSLAGGTALAVAANDGRMRLDDLASVYIASWRADPRRSRITIRHLATHTSGIEDAEEAGLPHAELSGWKGDFWRKTRNPFAVALEDAPVLFEPGSAFGYSSSAFAALGYAITASLRDAPEASIRELLRRRVMRPIGVPDAAWEIGYGTEHELDGLRLQAIWGGGSYTTRAVARVGQLFLNHGVWDGKELVDPEWIDAVTTHANSPVPDRSDDHAFPLTAAGWYTNADGVWPSVPTDAFAGAGDNHQILLVVPSLDLVAVRFGRSLSGPDNETGFWEAANRHLFEPLMGAIVTASPRTDRARTSRMTR